MAQVGYSLESSTKDMNREIVTQDNPVAEVGDSVQKESAIENMNQNVTTVEGNLVTEVGNTIQ